MIIYTGMEDRVMRKFLVFITKLCNFRLWMVSVCLRDCVSVCNTPRSKVKKFREEVTVSQKLLDIRS